VGNPADTKMKLEAIKGRLVSVTKAADLLAVARELEALGAALARDEVAAAGALWPRDMNQSAERPSEWGKDPKEDARG
jgi:hypothetical protein